MPDRDFWSEYEKRLREARIRRETKRRLLKGEYIKIKRVEAVGDVINKAIGEVSPVLTAFFRSKLNSSKTKQKQRSQPRNEKK